MNKKNAGVDAPTESNIDTTNPDAIMLKPFGDGEIDAVYQAHKIRIATGRQVTIIDQMKDYTRTKIRRDESATMNCGTHKHISILCKHISAHDGIKYTRLYPALRMIGFNHRYHEYKLGRSDVLYDISTIVNKCYMSTNPYIIDYISNDVLTFGKMQTTKYRFLDTDIGIATTESYNCGIKVSELNFYNVLAGINVLISNESYYRDIVDTPIVRPLVKSFRDINEMLQDRLSSLNAVSPRSMEMV